MPKLTDGRGEGSRREGRARDLQCRRPHEEEAPEDPELLHQPPGAHYLRQELLPAHLHLPNTGKDLRARHAACVSREGERPLRRGRCCSETPVPCLG